MYLILSGQLRKSSCFRYWRMASMTWQRMRYAMKWTKTAISKGEQREQSEKCCSLLPSSFINFLFIRVSCFFPVLTIFLHFTPASLFTSLCHLRQSHDQHFPIFPHRLLVLPLPFLLLLHIISSHSLLLICVPVGLPVLLLFYLECLHSQCCSTSVSCLWITLIQSFLQSFTFEFSFLCVSTQYYFVFPTMAILNRIKDFQFFQSQFQ